MSSAGSSAVAFGAGRLVRLLSALCLAGIAMRLTILALPPVIPLVHDDLHMSETQVGFVVGLPLAVFALASVPGSLLVARSSSLLTVILGMTIAALGGAARGGAGSVWTLYAAVIVMGFGIAITQPALPSLVREWMPHRVALGTVVYSCGMVLGATIASSLTLPLVLPLVGNNWRLDLGFWAIISIAMVPVFFLLSPRGRDARVDAAAIGGRWWPDWGSPAIWFLGLSFGGNNAAFYSIIAFLGDYLTSQDKADFLSAAFVWLNASQIVGLVLLIGARDRLQGRAWPFVVFGPLTIAGFVILMIAPTALGIAAAVALVGLGCVVTMTAILALPPHLSAPGDVSRTAAGMFTISYTCAILVPTISGALWDATGLPWMVFLPSCICAAILTVFGVAVTRGARTKRAA
jgi:CP family cyanate transporter-like MFS transporter